MRLLFPVLIFLLIAGIAIAGVVFWERLFGASAQSIARRISQAIGLRQLDKGENQLRQVIAEESGFSQWISSYVDRYSSLRLMLIRADAQITPTEYVILTFAMMVLVILLTLIFEQVNFLACLGMEITAILMPWFYFSMKAKKRQQKFEDQLPEALDYISRSMRAGHGLTAAIGLAADELQPPMGQELKITFDEINFGIPFQQAMANLMTRVNSADLRFFTVAVVIQRETGGNLTELLENLSKTIRERVKFRGKVRVLTAEGRASGILLSAMPFIMGALITWINPEYMQPLWGTPTGHSMIFVGLSMMGIGALIMRNMVQIEV